MLEENLQVRHAAKPVHNLSEISALRNMFSDKIKLLCIVHSETKELHAAALLYENVSVVKVQYFVITSYSIHYTKLYDLIREHIPQSGNLR